MPNTSFDITVSVMVPGWVVERTNESESSALALAAIEATAEDQIAAGWTLNGYPRIDSETGHLLVPLMGRITAGGTIEHKKIRSVINRYCSTVDGFGGLEALSEDEFKSAVNQLTLHKESITKDCLAA